MRPVLHRMFTSQEFYSPAALHTQIKSPIQWVVQNTRMLEIELPPKGPLANALRQMGQVPFYPAERQGMGRWQGVDQYEHAAHALQPRRRAPARHGPTRRDPEGHRFRAGDQPGRDHDRREMLDAKGNAMPARPNAPALAMDQIDLQNSRRSRYAITRRHSCAR